jgi:hypothetical protein
MFLPFNSTLHPLARYVGTYLSPFASKCREVVFIEEMWHEEYNGLNLATGLSLLLISFNLRMLNSVIWWLNANKCMVVGLFLISSSFFWLICFLFFKANPHKHIACVCDSGSYLSLMQILVVLEQW